MAKAIMIQGTASNSGKSFLAAALCRIFRQDGLRAAPFKSQNMALNSFITREGLEMGRAQVMQAEAAGIEPSVRMNPILLKPTSDMGSQVIVNGEVRGVMRAADYFRYKKELIPDILRAYESLAAEYDVIVLEGAGSPAEINLKDGDIVNMGIAQMAHAPVLLAGDIDRGGVFASLYGTVALLDQAEQDQIAGLVINKFRGDPAILRPGLSQLEALTGKPVLGVIPMLPVELDDEDSLSSRLQTGAGSGPVDVAVIRLPRLSNFTDFIPLEQEPLLTVRYVTSRSQLGAPDLIVLPGTKNTMADLLWLRQTGLEGAIQRLAASGTPILGVCGGYQMLGERLSDPDGAEEGGELRGMSLLPTQTIFRPQKTRTQAVGLTGDLPGFFSCLSSLSLTGYEIHMGKTSYTAPVSPFCTLTPLGEEPKEDGAVVGNVCGTYLHGLFDEGAAHTLARALAEKKGITVGEDGPQRSLAAFKEEQYNLLADGVRQNLDMDAIYRILERNV